MVDILVHDQDIPVLVRDIALQVMDSRDTELQGMAHQDMALRVILADDRHMDHIENRFKSKGRTLCFFSLF